MKHFFIILLLFPLSLFGQRDTVIAADLGFVVDTTNLIISGGDTTVRVVYLNKNSTQKGEILYYEQAPSSKATIGAIYNDLLARIPISGANSEAAYYEYQRRNTELVNLKREFLAIEEVMSTYYGYSSGALPEPEPTSSSGTVPAGGTTGQVLAKIDGTDYNTEWVDPLGGVPDLSDGQIAFGDGDNLMTSSEYFKVDASESIPKVILGAIIYDSLALLNTLSIACNYLSVNEDISVNGAKYGRGEMSVINVSESSTQFSVKTENDRTVVEYGRLDGGSLGDRYKFNGENSQSYVTNAANDHKFGINTDTPTVSLDVVGDIKTSSTVILQGFTVSTLPTGVIGMIAYVTDADSPTYLSTVVGGGSTVCKVFFDGSNWICN